MPGTVHDSLAESCMLSLISLSEEAKVALICCSKDGAQSGATHLDRHGGDHAESRACRGNALVFTICQSCCINDCLMFNRFEGWWENSCSDPIKSCLRKPAR